MRTFNTLSRPTNYEAARTLANYDDAKKPYTPIEIPKDMKYPKATITHPSLYAFIKGILP